MKILYHHRIASKDGQYVHVSEIIQALRAQGHEVLVVAPQMTESSNFGHDGGFVTKLKKKLPMALYELLELGYSFIVAVKLLKAIKSFQPDVIYERYNLYQPAGVMISKLMGVPLLLEVNAPLQEERAKFGNGLAFPRFAKAIEDYTWKKADRVLPVTRVLANQMTHRGVDEGKISVIHNGIKESLLEINKNKPVSQPDEIVIGFVGFMHLTCGVELVIKAMDDDPDFTSKVRLVCVGEENDAVKKMKEDVLTAGLTDKVTFTGIVDRDNVMNYVASFDVAILPAVTEYASPLKIFEYMVEKCAIIAPDSDNIKEIFPDANSVLLFGDNGETFTSQLKKVVNNPELIKELKQGSFDTLVKHGYTWDENARKIVSLSKQLASD